MPDFRSAVKFNKIPVVGFVPESGATEPSSPHDGQVFFNTTTEILEIWSATASAWLYAGGASLHAITVNIANDGDVSINSHKLTNVSDPSGTTTQDAATANWVTNQISTYLNGLTWKDPVDWATAAALAANTYASGPQTLTGNSNGAIAVDGGSPASGDRILVKNEGTGSHNGIYVVTTVGDGSHAYVLTRSADANTSESLDGATTVPVAAGGTANGGSVWLENNSGVILDTTALTFVQIGAPGTSYTAGTGITLTGNVFSLTAPVTVALGGTNSTTAAGARTSLGAPGLYNSGAIGDGSSTTLTVTHNLNNTIPNVQVWDISGSHPIKIDCDPTATDANTVTLAFATAPASGSIKCVVVG